MLSGRVAFLSLHSSPLAPLGTGDGGGMNVYVRSLAAELVKAGVECDVLTRAEDPEAPPIVEVEGGVRVVHLPVGPRRPIDRAELTALVDDLTDAVRDHVDSTPTHALHANYWVSGLVAHRLKHELPLPLVVNFHTLGHVKAAAGIDESLERIEAERQIARCADLVLAASGAERDAIIDGLEVDPERVELIAPGVDARIFHPGDRAQAQSKLGLAGRRVALFVGRVQPLKGLDLAVQAIDALADPTLTLVVVGGPSGPDGAVELARIHDLVTRLGLDDQVRFVTPQRHESLADFYRAAEVCLVPSRTESFGLVALEAAACGTPVVAADVGGLRTIVDRGETGLLVPDRDPQAYADALAVALAEGARLGAAAHRRSRDFRWSLAAARLRRCYADLPARDLVECR